VHLKKEDSLYLLHLGKFNSCFLKNFLVFWIFIFVFSQERHFPLGHDVGLSVNSFTPVITFDVRATLFCFDRSPLNFHDEFRVRGNWKLLFLSHFLPPPVIPGGGAYI